MGFRGHVRTLVEHERFQTIVISVIVANAVLLGLETSRSLIDATGPILPVLDHAMLTFFVVELVLRLYAHGPRFFRDPWNVFDLIVVGISVLPVAGPFVVLRALRILRVLRLVSAVPSLRRVVAGLLAAVPGMASVGALLALVIYVSAVIATNLFGTTSPDHFGNLGTTLFTLFQTMTGEAWPEIAAEVMDSHPGAWVFFVVYILVVSFAVLNLFIAVIVNGMEEISEEERKDDEQKDERLDNLAAQNREILAELRSLRAKLDEGGTA